MSQTVVQITAPEAVLYSLDRGFTLSEFEPGEFYSVPDYAAEGMIRRGWAKVARPDAPVATPHENPAVLDAQPPPVNEVVAVEDEHKVKKRSK